MYTFLYWTHSTHAFFGELSSKALGSLADAEPPASEPSYVDGACALLQMLLTLQSDAGVTTSRICAPSY